MRKNVDSIACEFLSNTFFEKLELKVKGFFTFKVYHGGERKEELHCEPKD